MRHSREEILELFKACRAKLGHGPGSKSFSKETGVKLSEVLYYWPSFGALIKEVGAQANEFKVRLPDDEVFRDYAKVCLHIGRIPTRGELRIAQRQLKTRTHSVYIRDGSIHAFRESFRAWLSAEQDEALKVILNYEGWVSAKENMVINRGSDALRHAPQLHPFLPGCMQYFDVLSRGEMPPFESSGVSSSMLFERRTADAFRCLGFEVQKLGQGTGRNADSLACAPRERAALIIDAKVRSNGYTLGTEDRKFLEYAFTHGKELQKQGFENVYLVVVAPSFRESDLVKLVEFISQSPVRSVAMITARALMRIVENSIRERSRFSLSDFTVKLFGNKIIAD